MRHVLMAIPGVILTIFCWGSYGPILHKGQAALGNDRLKPLICVGAAYFVIAIVVPLLVLAGQGRLSGDWSITGVLWSMTAGSAGALGALGIIWALTSGGKPSWVMPLVFGGAPIINVFVSMKFAGIRWQDAGPKFAFFLAGVVMVGIGAAMVLLFAPKKDKTDQHAARPAAVAGLAPVGLDADEPAMEQRKKTSPAETPATDSPEPEGADDDERPNA